MAINKQNKKVPRMPNDLVAESAVLGCMLINNNSVSKSIQLLEPNSFYDSKNRIIFENIIPINDPIPMNAVSFSKDNPIEILFN